MLTGLVRRPSPATAIASIALFVSLGGVSYGVATGSIDSREIKNGAVSTKDLKNNDVRSGDIRRGTVNSSDVRDNSLTGADVVESSLGTVPSASSAGSAGSANTANTANTANRATTAGTADNVSGRIPFQVRLSSGQTSTIATNGPVSIVAECDPNAGVDDQVRLLGATTAANSRLEGNDNLDGTGAANTLEPGTLAADRELVTITHTEGDDAVDNDIDEGFVMGPGGSYLGVDSESIALGANYAGAKCIITGVINSIG